MHLYAPILVALLSLTTLTTAISSTTDPSSIQQLEDIHTVTSSGVIEARAKPAVHGNFGKPGRLCPGEVATGTDKAGFACVMVKSIATGREACKMPKCISGAFKVLVEKAKAQRGNKTPTPKTKNTRRYNVLQRRDQCSDAPCDHDDDECAFYGSHCFGCGGDYCLSANL